MACGKTIIMREYPRAWKSGDEPYYPVNNPESQALLEKYQAEASKVKGLIIGGRLGEYRYYDMDQSISKALEAAKVLTGR
jgi:UDP-galactopyranose mutase